jgi:hypothetical protein
VVPIGLTHALLLRNGDILVPSLVPLALLKKYVYFAL